MFGLSDIFLVCALILSFENGLLKGQPTMSFESAQHLFQRIQSGIGNSNNNYNQIPGRHINHPSQFVQQTNFQTIHPAENFSFVKEQAIDSRRTMPKSNGVIRNQFKQQNVNQELTSSASHQKHIFSDNSPASFGFSPSFPLYQQTFNQGQSKRQLEHVSQRNQLKLGETLQQSIPVTNQPEQQVELLQREVNNVPTGNIIAPRQTQLTGNDAASSFQDSKPVNGVRIGDSVSRLKVPIQENQNVRYTQNINLSEAKRPDPSRHSTIKFHPKKQFEDEELVRKQAETAKYTFNSQVNDRINDNSIVRSETRDGLKLSGVYSYSDGYYKRTVHYEADENGYRVVKENSELIGNGPKTNYEGTADVSSHVGGKDIQYSIKAQDIFPFNPPTENYPDE